MYNQQKYLNAEGVIIKFYTKKCQAAHFCVLLLFHVVINKYKIYFTLFYLFLINRIKII